MVVRARTAGSRAAEHPAVAPRVVVTPCPDTSGTDAPEPDVLGAVRERPGRDRVGISVEGEDDQIAPDDRLVQI